MVLVARPLSPVLLFALVPVASWFVIRPLLDPAPSLPGLYASFGFSIFALLATLYLVPALGPSFVRANLKGKDLLKVYDDPMCVALVYRFILSRESSWLSRPESMGLVCAAVYVLLLLLFIPFPFSLSTSILGRSRDGISLPEGEHRQVSIKRLHSI
jgi:UDP-N-acetylglucosamine--dolichyl-phosphate N-acetylglucosaminephosphotransferase